MRELTHRRNRALTSFWYLSDPDGGETGFPLAHGAKDPGQHHDCSDWMKVEARRGRAIFFYSLHADASLNPASKHAGCKVTGAPKWSANFWTWNTPADEFGTHIKRSIKDDPEIMQILKNMDLSLQDALDCRDENEDCQEWAEMGECEANPDYMLRHCRISCKSCGSLEETDEDDDSMDDDSEHDDNDKNLDASEEDDSQVDDSEHDENEDDEGDETEF